jgi:hypothetical protein
MAATVPPLQDSGFDQNDITAMSRAVDEICQEMRVPDGDNPARRAIAERLIALARRGERSPTVLRDRVLRKRPPPVRQFSITLFLQDQVFDPALIDTISTVFDKVTARLGLSPRVDRITELVARHIIELTTEGMRNPTALYLQTLYEFKANPQ